MKLLSKDQIDALHQEVQSSQEKINANVERTTENTNDVHSLMEKLKNLQEEMDTASVQLESVKSETARLGVTNKQLTLRIQEIEQQLSEDERQKRILDLVAQQPEFYDAILTKIIQAQDELEEDVRAFIELADPNKAVHRIRSDIEQMGNFRNEAIDLRGIKARYTNLIEQLCTAKVDGQKITIEASREPSAYLDAMVRRTPITSYWQ